MSPQFRLRPPTVLAMALLTVALAGCSGISNPFSTSEAPPPAPPIAETLSPSFPPQDMVGRWGLAAYHKEEDRARTEAAAANQCRQPYIITPGPTGGVMMHLADQSTPTELRLKGAPGNRNFIGPAEDPPGGQQDREVVHFDGRVMALRWIDTEVQGRYGTMVYVRCGPEGQKPTKSKAAAKPRPKAAPKTAPKPVQPPVQRQ
ncbi:MAG TPA: hypothetical protein VGM57_17350 [Pseudolabrys sp.]